MKRGDIYLADLDPSKGSEQAGRRPVLVIEDDRLIPATLTVVVLPFTSNLALQELPTCVFAPAGEGGLRRDSVVVCHQIRALDKRAFLDRWGSLPDERMLDVELAVLRALGFSGRIKPIGRESTSMRN